MRRWLIWLVLFASNILGSFAAAHEVTFSRVDLYLDTRQTRLEVRLPVKALLHEQPSPLPAGTTARSLSAPPTGEVRAALTRLLDARLRVWAGPRRLGLTVQTVSPLGEDVALTLSAPPALGALKVEADLFPADSLHKEFVSVYRAGELVGQYALDHQNSTFALEAPRRPLGEVVLTFVREGIHHIFIGPDHILFVVALILLGGGLATQARIITAFTLAHSVTLALATLGLVSLPPRLVESAIALSIVVVGLHDLRRLRRGDPDPAGSGRDHRAAFAFGFGLIHGFGFARVLSELELPREALGWSLAAFNVGVELGQVLIVLGLAPLLLALRRLTPSRVSRAALPIIALGVVLVGGVWFCQRLFWSA